MRLFVPLIALVLALCPRQTWAVPKADEVFDKYGAIPWVEEKARLYGFGLALQKELEFVGYILYCAPSDVTLKARRQRAERARNYLISELKLSKKRVVLVDRGICDEGPLTILQPLEKGARP